MTLNQAKTKVAMRLRALGAEANQILAVIDMTRDDSIMEAANLVDHKPDISLDDLKLFVYWPEIGA
jgi:hypothetical protein